LTSALVGDEWSASPSGRFTPGERALGTHWIGGWVDPKASLEDVKKRKFLTLLDSNADHSVVQPVVSRYTDCHIPKVISIVTGSCEKSPKIQVWNPAFQSLKAVACHVMLIRIYNGRCARFHRTNQISKYVFSFNLFIDMEEMASLFVLTDKFLALSDTKFSSASADFDFCQLDIALLSPQIKN
jgi:hypothetical protein